MYLSEKLRSIFTGFGMAVGIILGGIMMMYQQQVMAESVKLPKPSYSGHVAVETALQQRRSVREYLNTPLTLTQVSQLLWAAQGISSVAGYRTTPSAGALYPLELYVVVGQVTGLGKGVYKYQPHTHELLKIAAADIRSELASAALEQSPVKDGAMVLVLSAVYGRTTQKYGGRGIQYVHMEVGHVAQNVYLQAVALELGTVFIGAFQDERVKKILALPAAEAPLGIMPIGKPR